jgi:hypothetical protein
VAVRHLYVASKKIIRLHLLAFLRRVAAWFELERRKALELERSRRTIVFRVGGRAL